MPIRLTNAEAERLVVENQLLPPAQLEVFKGHTQGAPDGALYDLLVQQNVITYDMQVELEQAKAAAQPQAGLAPRLGGGMPAPALGKPAPKLGGLASGSSASNRAYKPAAAPLLSAGAAPAPSAAPAAPPLQAPAPAVAPAVPAVLPTRPPASAAPINIPPPAVVPGGLARPKRRRGFEDEGGAAPAAPAAAPAPAAIPAPAVPAPAGIPAPAPAPAAAAPAAPPSDHGGHGGHAEVASEKKIPQGWPNGVAPENPAPGGIQDLLKKARAADASDMHVVVGLPVMARVHGHLRPLQEGSSPMTAQQTRALIQMMLTPDQFAHFDRTGDLDLCYSFQSGGRYRTNVLRHRNGEDIACRVIGEKIFTVEELGLPPQAARLTEFAQGLVLVTGPSGHGKTTTMVALVELVNQRRPDHIITVEDPIEYILKGKSCQVTQREVGPHTESFATALRAALREDPDIIVIGELRDYDTTSMAISAAETGHLVFGSLPTQNAAKTIDKVIDVFPSEEQFQIRLMVSESLRGIISQQLIPRKDGSGRVAAVELLFNSVAVGNIVREAKTEALVNAMQLGKGLGMVLMDESLQALVQKEVIAGEEAWARAEDRRKFAQFAPKEEPKQAPAAAAAPAKPGLKR